MNTAFAFALLLFTAVVSAEVLASGGGFEPLTDEGGGGASEVQNAGAEGSRRFLHEPFMPTISIAPSPGAAAPSEPPAEPPTVSEQPAIPTTNQPFFPVTPNLPAPPPPDPSTTVTIPANISGLIPPQEESPAKKNEKPRKIIVVIVVISSVIFAMSALLFYLNRRRARDLLRLDKYVDDRPPLRSSNVRNGSDSVRTVESPAPMNKVAFNGGSDVLYLGTLEPVPSRNSNGDYDPPHADPPPRSDGQTDSQRETHNSPYHPKSGVLNRRDVDNDELRRASAEEFRRESPEIYPLPPLSKRLPPSASMDSSDEESFYSPGCPSTPSSSRDNSDSPRISICKRLFSPPPQQSSRGSLQPLSTPSYPSSATSSSSPSPLNSPPQPPITPIVLAPPIRSHFHSPPPSKSEPQPPIVLPSSQQLKPPPPPPPPPPAPLFQLPDPPTPPPAKQKPIQAPLFQLPDPLTPPPARQKPNPNPNIQSSPFPPAEQKRNLPSPSSPHAKHSPDPQSSPSPLVKQKPDPQSPPSSPANRSSQPTLPPLPARPPPRFFNSSRSGKLSQLPSPLSKQPPPPPPPPVQNKNTSPESPLPPLPLRPSYRAQLPLLNSARTGGQSSQPLAPASVHSIPANSAEQFNATGADGTPRPKLKPLHWDKVRASPDRAMVWDQLKSGSFQLNEEMIETLFVYNTTNTVKSELAKRPLVHPPGQNQRILDPKKSQNIAIQLRALNVTREEVCDALLEGTCETLGTELLENLVKMAPSKEEEVRLKEYNADISKLGPAERFLKGLLDIPFAFKRIDAMLYRASFEEEVNYIKNSFKTLEAACEELRSSRLFLKLLEAVLKTGNRMNVGTIRGDAQAFKLDTLLKLADVKGTDGKTTLLHFVVQEIIRAEGTRVASTGDHPVSNSTSVNIDGKVHPLGWEVKGLKDKEDDYRRLGLQVVAGLSTELSNVKNAAGIDSDALTSSVSQLARGLGKLREILQVDFTRQTKEGKINEKITQGNFYKSMTSFLHQAEEDVTRIQNEEMRAFSLVKEITEYFHGDAAKEEAHPFRLFVIVRDFLGVLQQVCKEVARMQTKSTSSPARLPPVSVHTLSRPLFPQFYEKKPDSSDDESSSP